jgi:hypothetical protein
MVEPLTSEKCPRVSLEGLSALRAVALGDAYLKARTGAQRAGRTSSLRTLMRQDLLEHDGSVNGWKLTELGKRIVEARTNE